MDQTENVPDALTEDQMQRLRRLLAQDWRAWARDRKTVFQLTPATQDLLDRWLAQGMPKAVVQKALEAILQECIQRDMPDAQVVSASQRPWGYEHAEALYGMALNAVLKACNPHVSEAEWTRLGEQGMTGDEVRWPFFDELKDRWADCQRFIAYNMHAFALQAGLAPTQTTKDKIALACSAAGSKVMSDWAAASNEGAEPAARRPVSDFLELLGGGTVWYASMDVQSHPELHTAAPDQDFLRNLSLE